MKAINSFVTNGLQNTLFYAPQKKVSHSGFEMMTS